MMEEEKNIFSLFVRVHLGFEQPTGSIRAAAVSFVVQLQFDVKFACLS